MGKSVTRVLLVALLGLMLLPLSGCAKKSVMLEPAAEPTRVEDTVGAGVPTEKGVSTPPPVENLVVEEVNEGAGPAESLVNPSSDESSMVSSPDTLGASSGATIVPGSRTSEGLLPVYFDFDKALISQEQQERLVANGRFLKDTPGGKVRIEGNCDERGTNEYNLALGQRRAASAKKYLVNLGISAARLSSISYGEEQPLKIGNDEAAWSENRRVDFVVVQ